MSSEKSDQEKARKMLEENIEESNIQGSSSTPPSEETGFLTSPVKTISGWFSSGDKKAKSSSASPTQPQEMAGPTIPVSKITLTKKERINDIQKIEEKIINEIASFSDELRGRINVKVKRASLKSLKDDVEGMGKMKVGWIAEIIENYLYKADNYEVSFLKGVEKEEEKVKTILTLLYNHSLFPYAAKHHAELNSSIADGLAKCYQNSVNKSQIDNQIDKLVAGIKKVGEHNQIGWTDCLEIWSLGEKISELKGEVDQKRKEIENYQETLAVAEEEIMGLYERLVTAEKGDDNQAEVELLKSKLTDLTEKFQQKGESLSELLAQEQRENEKLLRDISRLHKRLEAVEKNSETNQQEIAKKALEALTLFEDKQKELTELKQELRAKEKELEATKNDITKFEAEWKEKEEKIARLRERTRKLKEKADEAKNQQAIISLLEKEIAEKEKEKQAIKGKKDTAEKKRAAAEEKLAEMQAKNEELTKAVEENLVSFMGQLTDLQKGSQKYSEILISLGLEEADFAEFGGKISDFFASYLGQKEDRTQLTLKDIRAGEGIDSLADLLTEYQKLKSQSKEVDTPEIIINEGETIADVANQEKSPEELKKGHQRNKKSLSLFIKPIFGPKTEPETAKELKIKAEELKEKLNQKYPTKEEKERLQYSILVRDEEQKKTVKETKNWLDDTIQLLEQEEREEKELGVKLARVIIAEEYDLTAVINELTNYLGRVTGEHHDLVQAIVNHHQNKELIKTGQKGLSQTPPPTPLPRIQMQEWALNRKSAEVEKNIAKIKTEKESLVRQFKAKEAELATKTAEIARKDEEIKARENALSDWENKLGFKLAILVNYPSDEPSLLNILEIDNDYIKSKENLPKAVKEQIDKWKYSLPSEWMEAMNNLDNETKKSGEILEEKNGEIINLNHEKTKLEEKISSKERELKELRNSKLSQKNTELEKTNSRLKWGVGILGLTAVVSIMGAIWIKRSKVNHNEAKDE